MLWEKTKLLWKNGLKSSGRMWKIMLFCCFVLCLYGCENSSKEKSNIQEKARKETEGRSSKESANSEEDQAELIEKGYDLPVEEQERKEAEEDCKKGMELISDIYKQADKGEVSNVVLSDKVIEKMQKKLKETNCPVASMVAYSNMENYEKMDKFLKVCKKKTAGEMVVYEICSDGGIERMKYCFDGEDLYVLNAKAVWNEKNKAEFTWISYTRIKEWNYTKKGWFGYELCVPEPPEVSEIVDGSFLLRIKPMNKENREYSEKCVQKIGYQGNNLLCSDWNQNQLDGLDYNGLYEYLYQQKYKARLEADDYPDGIPRDEFEGLIMEYLPVTSGQLQKYAVFDEEKQTYANEQLGCFNYAPSFFGTSVPEVVAIKETKDGTVTLTVDAVCDMVLCEDALITHELTVRFVEDGTFQYLGNKIVGGEIANIPNYQYRFEKEETQ